MFFFFMLYANRARLREMLTKAQIGFLYAAYNDQHWYFGKQPTQQRQSIRQAQLALERVSVCVSGWASSGSS